MQKFVCLQKGTGEADNNGDKTAFVTIESKHDKIEPQKIQINTENNYIITNGEMVKIFGFIKDRSNAMDTQLNSISSKVGMKFAKLRPVLTY